MRIHNETVSVRYSRTNTVLVYQRLSHGRTRSVYTQFRLITSENGPKCADWQRPEAAPGPASPPPPG